MKSKTFCFNKTIFLKNVTHFWPIWGAYTLYLIIVLPVNLWLTSATYQSYAGYTETQRRFSVLNDVLGVAFSPYVTFLAAAVCVLAVFSYLYSAKSANMIHALPVNRLELFATNFLSAAAFMLIPQVFSFVVAVFVCIAENITSLEYLLFWLLAVMGETFFALALGAFVAMLTGQLVVFPVYYAVANFLYVGCAYLVAVLEEFLYFGVSMKFDPGRWSVLSPVYYLAENVYVEELYDSDYDVYGLSASGGGAAALYALAGVALAVAAYCLYRRRRIEAAGDVVAVCAVRPVFRWGFAVCAGLAFGTWAATGASVLASFADKFWLLFAFVLALEAIGFFVAEMLIRKNFRVFCKRRVLEWAALAALSAALLGAFEADAFGVENWIPDESEILRVTVDFDYTLAYGGEDAAWVTDLHRQILENKDEFEESEPYFMLGLNYTLRDGTVRSRYYSVPNDAASLSDADSVASRILAVESVPENMLANLFGNNYETNEYYAGYITFVDENDMTTEYRFSDEELTRILAALTEDIGEGNLNRYLLYSTTWSEVSTADVSDTEEYMNSLQFSFYNPDGVTWNFYYGDDYEEYYEAVEATSGSAYVSFGAECVHVVETLKELGVVNDERQLLTYGEYEALFD